MEGMHSNTTTTSAGMGIMSTGFHTGGGDMFWISSLRPQSPPAVLGASIILFLLAIFSRFLDALQRTLHSTRSLDTSKLDNSHNTSALSFQLKSDGTIGLFFLLHSALAYLFMLAVMTYNAFYFVAIILGLGFGEASFGRFGRHS